jgi:murein DD-endopeptidase MepM/ murein hydrolase activator NlpD
VTGELRVHTGVDLAAPAGTPILAAAAGTVAAATSEYDGEPARGLVVVLDHGQGYMTYYGHLESIDVPVGDPVDAGATIGLVGSTGLSTGPHVHFEIWAGGESVNPLDYIER